MSEKQDRVKWLINFDYEIRKANPHIHKVLDIEEITSEYTLISYVSALVDDAYKRGFQHGACESKCEDKSWLDLVSRWRFYGKKNAGIKTVHLVDPPHRKKDAE